MCQPHGRGHQITPDGSRGYGIVRWISDDVVRFKKADKLWGSQTGDCQQMIKNDLGDQNIRIACIGPAGEKLSKISAILLSFKIAMAVQGPLTIGKEHCYNCLVGCTHLKLAKSGQYAGALAISNRG